MSQRQSTRREFLQRTGAGAAALGAAYFVPAHVLGGGGATPPSDRIVMGTIGVGGMGRGNTNMFLSQPDTQLVAVCDVDERHLARGQDLVNKHYGNQDCATYRDFRELLAREDIDAVVVATPDHWHALAAIAAANAGKDIYCEKPLANSIGEGRAIVEAVTKNNRILQTGCHERAGDNARFACKLVRDGYFGKVHTVEINLPTDDRHHQRCRAVKDVPPPMDVPEGFDFDFWLGHTPQVAYTEKRCHFGWRFILSYGGGEMTDRGAHVIDIAQLGLGTDRTGPVEIRATGTRNEKSLFNAFWDYEFENVFESGVRMLGKSAGPRGLKFVGDEGWIFVHIHGAVLESEPESLLEDMGMPYQDSPKPDREPHILNRRNFLDCVKSRDEPFSPPEVGHRTATLCHLNNIAMLVGQPLKWDPVAERFDNDQANALVTPKMREPWTL
jgi:predicted dehydrogenase